MTYEIPGAIEITPLSDSGSKVTLFHAASETSVEIYTFGATVTAWRARTGENSLFLSEKADLSGAQAIRGGIPIIFPQFGNGPLPAHGLARNRDWELVLSEMGPHLPTTVTLKLESNRKTLAIWPHKFLAEYTISLDETLRTELRITNTGDTDFSFQAALHSYFSIADIERVAISDLSTVTYIDKLAALEHKTENNSELRISSETDRVYLNSPNTILVRDETSGTGIAMEKSGFADAVVWNPWIEKSAGMKDLSADDFKKFVCVEAGQIDTPVTLAPGLNWIGIQELQRIDLQPRWGEI